MPTFDSAWDDLTAISDLTTSRWNDVKNDLKTWLAALDDDFFGANTLLAAVIDGVAMTLDDPSAGASEQVITRQTRTTGSWSEDGTVLHPVTEFANDTSPDVTGVHTLFLSASAGALIVTRFDNGTEGQVIKVIRYHATNNITFDHDATGTGVGSVEGEIYLQGAVNNLYNGGNNPEVSYFIYTDLNGTLTNAVWLELATSANY